MVLRPTQKKSREARFDPDEPKSESPTKRLNPVSRTPSAKDMASAALQQLDALQRERNSLKQSVGALEKQLSAHQKRSTAYTQLHAHALAIQEKLKRSVAENAKLREEGARLRGAVHMLSVDNETVRSQLRAAMAASAPAQGSDREVAREMARMRSKLIEALTKARTEEAAHAARRSNTERIVATIAPELERLQEVVTSEDVHELSREDLELVVEKVLAALRMMTRDVER